jgi:hypothetical protein
MVIERFRNADPKPIGGRLRRNGRMPTEGLYHVSWVDSEGGRVVSRSWKI